MICDKKKCSGCFCCYNICPKNAIEMTEDKNGFIYPVVDENKCIKCGLCRKTCPSNNPSQVMKPISCYAVIRNNIALRKKSSSGGVASAIAERIILDDGIVYGSVFSDGVIKHVRMDNPDLLELMRGSKYVHSYIGNCFKQISFDLNSNKKVLFIGTPCQVSGLRNYLKKEYDNLYLVDIICHGVPSQKYLKDELISKAIDIDKLKNIKFRDNNKYVIITENKNGYIENIDYNNSYYLKGFVKSSFNRENCYTCSFSSSNRCSDLTLGDFWGLGNDSQFFNDKENGVSLVFSITERGKKLLEMISEDITLEERDINEAIKGNSQLNSSPTKPNNYYKFKKDYPILGFVKSYRRNFKYNYYVSKIKSNTFVRICYQKLKGDK